MDGDEDAMEKLTMEDMDTYAAISRQIQTQDVYSIVDSYFMPYGVECDMYSVMGEIISDARLRCRTRSPVRNFTRWCWSATACSSVG
jgi:hypothetical protein